MRVSIECPYCGLVQNRVVDMVTYEKVKVETCDTDAGGCDRDFVAKYTLVINTNIRKIEGEDKS